MSERATSSEANLSKEQTASLYEQGERLFLGGTFRFGGAGEGSYHLFPRNRIRYRLDDELVSLSAPYAGAEGVPRRINIVAVAVETPLPPTDRWPNTYLQHCYVVPKSKWDGLPLDCHYNYFMMATEYSPDGEFSGPVRGAVSSLNLAQGMRGRSADREREELKLGDIRRVYPDYADLFREQWITDRFGDGLELLARLSLMDEVGCEPNPYVRDQD